MKKSSKSKEDLELKKEYDFSKGVRGRFYRPHKVSTTIRIDDDILLLFKKIATERKTAYHTLMNNALREYLKKTA
jgi:uncharacterized protein (DUF4415 family)